MPTFELISNAPFAARVEGKEPTGSSVHPGVSLFQVLTLPSPVVAIPCIGMYLSLTELEKGKIRLLGCVNTEK